MKWTHTDVELKGSIDRARSAALNGQLDRKTIAPWLVLCAYTQAGLSGNIAYTENEGETALELTPAGPNVAVIPQTQERVVAAAVLYRTITMFAESAGWNGAPPDRAELVTSAVRETGFLPLIAAIGVVIVRTAGVAAIAWVAVKAVEVGGVLWARHQTAQELARTDMVARELVEKHVDREVGSGKALPLDAATKLALDNLAKRQAALSESLKAPPAPQLPDLNPNWGWLAAAAVGLVFVLKS